jgi:DNA-directed RNA polymerase specialized sigma subunit
MKSGLKALKKFDPKRGVKASTFVTGSLKEANRPLLRRATILRVPEARLQKVGPVRRATRELEDALGRPPTVQEIAKHAKVSPKVVKLLQREVSPIHIVSKEQVRKGDIGTHVKEMWDLLGPELEGTEKKVYELLSADPKATNTQIAKKIRVTPSQVSRYRQRLRRRVLADN